MKNIIYALCEPGTEIIRYIGKSTTGEKRIKEHLKPRDYLRNTHKSHWIHSLIQKGLSPSFLILHEADTPDELNALEMFYIKQYKDSGANLTNATEGGEGSLGWKPSEDNKRNMRIGRANYLANLKTPLKAWNKMNHINIDGKEFKQCSCCGKVLELNQFGKYKQTWDGLNRHCKTCHNRNVNAYRKDKNNKLTEEQWEQSYIDRKEKMAEGIKKAFQDNPELAKQISKNKSKAIKGVSITDGHEIKFESALIAKNSGFNNTNIGQAIKHAKPYKGYIWSFV